LKTKLAVFLLSLSLIAYPAVAASNPKAGAACTQIGLTQIYKNLKFTCIKSGAKKVWDKGTKVESTTAITAENYIFSSLCEPDPFVPAEWKEFYQIALKNNTCTGGYRYVAGPTNFATPNIAITPTSELKSADICKLTNSGNNSNALRGFPMRSYFFKPTVRANIQMLAVSFPDALALGNPYSDHEKEIKLFLETLVNSSDVPINPDFRKVDKYLKMPKNVEDYKVYEHQPNMSVFTKDVVGLWDSEINFSDVDYVFIVAPTSLTVQQFNRAIWTDFSTAEKKVTSAFVAGPLKSDGTNRNVQYPGMTQDQWLPQMPFAMIHEGIYHQLGLDDHLGDEKYLRPDSIAPRNSDDLGTGRWGNMSTMVGDLLIWDKWTVGFINDSQVRCVDTSKSSTHWLRPGSSKGITEKLIVIPLSNTKGIVIESRRSTGLNYLYPKASEGALVYTVDTMDSRFGFGIAVKRPANRPENHHAYGFSLGDAALKKGESIQINGFNISVIDSGNFGDVVKVEKI
jgi:hypothetical protein